MFGHSWMRFVAEMGVGICSLLLLVMPLALLASSQPGASHLIAISSNRIALIDVEKRLLYRLDDAGTYPTWSPDGRWLAYVAGSEVVARAVGGDRRRHIAWGYAPSWSPDGRRVAFWMNYYGNSEIYVAELSGGTVRLTDHFARDAAPAWSPDGRFIAFQSDREANIDIYLLPVTCMDRPDYCEETIRRLTDHAADDYQPEWSPDGRQIAFYSSRSGPKEIFVMDADGSNVRQLTHSALCRDTAFLAWSPDGTMITYSACDGDAINIYGVRVDGSAPSLLMDGLGLRVPLWTIED